MTSNALQVFSYKNKEVRTTEIDGEIWFVAKDVALALEYKDTDQAVRSHVADEDKLTRDFYGTGQKRAMIVINESGVYALILSSTLPSAKEFKHWVTHDVLPTIRKTGSYNAKFAFDPMQGARAVFEAAGIKDNQLALAMDKVYRSYTGRSALEAGEIALTAPTKKQILTPTEIGKHFNMKAQRVNEILAGAGYQHKINDKWEALPPGEPYAVMQDVGKSHNNGTPIRQLKWDSSILSAFSKLMG